jgi:hypothetical protein
MKATTTSTQPRSSEGDQTGRATDFIDSIGHLQTLRFASLMSALPPKGDVRQRIEHVCFVPILLKNSSCEHSFLDPADRES